MNVPESYRNQDGCHNCAHCVKITEYDDPDTFYCNVDGSERPLSGSVFMGEMIWSPGISDDEAWENCQKWDRWANSREVKAFGICDNFQVSSIQVGDRVKYFTVVDGQRHLEYEGIVKEVKDTHYVIDRGDLPDVLCRVGKNHIEKIQ